MVITYLKLYVAKKEENVCLLGQTFSCAIKGVLDCKKKKKKRQKTRTKISISLSVFLR